MEMETGLADPQEEALGEGVMLSAAEGEAGEQSHSAIDPQVAAAIAAEVERRFQSAKDKRWAALEKQYEAVQEAASAQSTPAAQNSSTAQDISEEQAATLAEKSVNTQENYMETVETLLHGLGLSKDPAARAMVQAAGESPTVRDVVGLVQQISRYALLNTAGTTASPGSVIQPGEGKLPSEDLQSAYDAARKRLRPGDVNALFALKQAYRKKGLRVF